MHMKKSILAAIVLASASLPLGGCAAGIMAAQLVPSVLGMKMMSDLKDSQVASRSADGNTVVMVDGTVYDCKHFDKNGNRQCAKTKAK